MDCDLYVTDMDARDVLSSAVVSSTMIQTSDVSQAADSWNM